MKIMRPFIFVSVTAECIERKAKVIDFNYYDKIHRASPFAAWKHCFCGPLLKSRYFSNKSIKLREMFLVGIFSVLPS